MPPQYHRTIDSSIFIEVYLEQRNATECITLLDALTGRDTLICDLVVGEVVSALLRKIDDQRTFETGLSDFMKRLRTYTIHPLDPDAMALAKTEPFSTLRCQDKDRILIAWAMRRTLTRFATLDRGILDEQPRITAECASRGAPRLTVESPLTGRARTR